jgi:hypothetical protein
MNFRNLLVIIAVAIFASACTQEQLDAAFGLDDSIDVLMKLGVGTRGVGPTRAEINTRNIPEVIAPDDAIEARFEIEVPRRNFDADREVSERVSVRVITLSGVPSCTARVTAYRFELRTVTFDQRSFQTERGTCFFSVFSLALGREIPVLQSEVYASDGVTVIGVEQLTGPAALQALPSFLLTE